MTEAGPAALAPQDRDWDILLTAETHNFPCAVAPYPGMYWLKMAAHHACIHVHVTMGCLPGAEEGPEGIFSNNENTATLLAGKLLCLACMTCHICCR